jgi:predicted nuclease with TOPRIM domain
MRQELQRKLDELKKEFDVGQKRLRELETEQTYVRETMLRISGAIQVLQDILGDGEEQEPAETGCLAVEQSS